MNFQILRRALSVAVLAGVVAPAITAAQPTKALSGYQCMSLAKLWDGEGPQPPPVPVFTGPGASAQQAGIAGGTIIVAFPLQVVDGRTKMLFADGRTVWIGASNIVPFHVVSNPHATCTPVLLANGRYGFETKH
jgi:hypothetical protein